MNTSDGPRGPWPDPDERGEARPDPGEPEDPRAEDERLRRGSRGDRERRGRGRRGSRRGERSHWSITSTTSTTGWAAWDERTEAKGSKGVALAVAGLNLGGLLALPAMLVIGIYTFITVYAVVKAVGAGSDEANALVVLLGVVGLVTLFVTMLGVGAWLVGRSADPKKRRR